MFFGFQMLLLVMSEGNILEAERFGPQVERVTSSAPGLPSSEDEGRVG